jgi:hypothetical protein
MVSVIPRKKVLIPRHSEFRGRANSEARNGAEFRKKMKFYGTDQILNKITLNQGGGNQFLTGGFFGFFLYVLYSTLLHHPLCRMMAGSNPGQLRLWHWLSDAYISSTLGYISSTLGYVSSNSYGLYKNHLNTVSVRDWRCCVLFRVVFYSAEWFGTEFLEFFYFSSTKRNSELFSLPLKGSEGNSEILLLFLFHGTEFQVVFSSAKGVRMGIMKVCFYFWSTENGIPSCFLFHGRVRNGIPRISVPRNSRNSVGNNHLFRLFRLPRNYFFVGNSQP